MTFNFSKCPKCEALVSSVNINDVDGYVSGISRWRCISFSCRSCNAVLSVQMDPIAIKTDLLNELKAR